MNNASSRGNLVRWLDATARTFVRNPSSIVWPMVTVTGHIMEGSEGSSELTPN